MQPDLEWSTVRDKAGRKGILTIGIHFQDGFLGLEGKETHVVTTLPCVMPPTAHRLTLTAPGCPQCCAEACGICCTGPPLSSGANVQMERPQWTRTAGSEGHPLLAPHQELGWGHPRNSPSGGWWCGGSLE